MPFKIFGWKSVSFHRGEAVKNSSVLGPLTKQPKDAVLQARARTPQLLPDMRPQQRFPSVTIEPVRSDNQFLAAKDLQKELRKVSASSSCDSPEALARIVSTHIATSLDKIRREPKTEDGDRNLSRRSNVVILVGDDHRKHASTMVRLAALRAMKDRGATALFEMTEEEVNQLSVAARFSAGEYASNPEIECDHQLTLINSRDAYVLDALVAEKCGISLGHFDPMGHTANSQFMREAAMTEAIWDQLTEGPTMVLTGAVHLPYIKEWLEFQKIPTICVTHVDEQMFLNIPQHRRRISTLMADKDICRIFPSKGVGDSFHPLRFCNETLGVDIGGEMSAPESAPLQSRQDRVIGLVRAAKAVIEEVGESMNRLQTQTALKKIWQGTQSNEFNLQHFDLAAALLREPGFGGIAIPSNASSMADFAAELMLQALLHIMTPPHEGNPSAEAATSSQAVRDKIEVAPPKRSA